MKSLSVNDALCYVQRKDSLGNTYILQELSPGMNLQISNCKPPEICIMSAVTLLPKTQKLHIKSLWHHHLYVYGIQRKGNN